MNTTLAPPSVKLLPAASRACKVSVTALPDATVGADTVTTELAAEIGPGVTASVGSVEVTTTPSMVAPIVVAVPAITPVKLAVYVPLA